MAPYKPQGKSFRHNNTQKSLNYTWCSSIRILLGKVSRIKLWKLVTAFTVFSCMGTTDNGLLGASEVDSLCDPYLEPRLPCSSIGSDTVPMKSFGDPIFTFKVNPLPHL